MAIALNAIVLIASILIAIVLIATVFIATVCIAIVLIDVSASACSSSWSPARHRSKRIAVFFIVVSSASSL